MLRKKLVLKFQKNNREDFAVLNDKQGKKNTSKLPDVSASEEERTSARKLIRHLSGSKLNLITRRTELVAWSATFKNIGRGKRHETSPV